jgi:SAM-dependent methyltransferase
MFCFPSQDTFAALKRKAILKCRAMVKQPNYGIDGPKFVRNVFILAIVLYAIAIFFLNTSNTSINLLILSVCIISGTVLSVEGLLMLLYVKKGKLTHRNRILNLIDWKGNEIVLDIGTGLGLLAIGAAKKLITGKAIGIDIWNKDDLSENSAMKANLNAELENVAGKVEFRDGNILATDFPTDQFDVVLTNLCLHNVGDKENRKTACKEIHRILKPNGIAIISDFIHNREYKETLMSLGMKIEKKETYFLNTYQPLTIIKAIKK